MPERGNLLLGILWTFLEIAILSLRSGKASPFRTPRNNSEPRETNWQNGRSFESMNNP